MENAIQTSKPDAGSLILGPEGTRRTARRILSAFLLTFLASRFLVLLIMSHKVPDLYLYLGGTHVHHLNYGIFLLAGVSGYLLLHRAPDRRIASILYGVGMGLTFDEFGMWLHLGGSYWQRASWDAVAVIIAGLGLFAYGPSLAQYRPRHWTAAALLLVVIVAFLYFLARSLEHAEQVVIPRLERIEQRGPQ